MSKKDFNIQNAVFLRNPAEQFISGADTPKAEPQQAASEAEPQGKKEVIESVPAGYKVVGNTLIEKRTKRLPLLLQPTLYKVVKKDAAKHKCSVNTMIHAILEDYYKKEIEK